MKFWDKLKSGGIALLLDCREASRAQSEQLDHPLPRGKRVGLWLHLLICQWCRRYGSQIRFLRHAANEHHEDLTEAAPHGLSNEARDRIKQRLQQKS
jgi:hypothetical protein